MNAYGFFVFFESALGGRGGDHGAGDIEGKGPVDVLDHVGRRFLAVDGHILGNGQAAVGQVVVGEVHLGGLVFIAVLGLDCHADRVFAGQMDLPDRQGIGDLGDGVFAGDQLFQLGAAADAVLDLDVDLVVEVVQRALDDEPIPAVDAVLVVLVQRQAVEGHVLGDQQLAGVHVVGELGLGGLVGLDGDLQVVGRHQHHVRGQRAGFLGHGVLAGHHAGDGVGLALAVFDLDRTLDGQRLHVSVIQRALDDEGVGAVRRLGGGGFAVQGDILGDGQLAGGQVVGEAGLDGLRGGHCDHLGVLVILDLNGRDQLAGLLLDGIAAGQQAAQRCGLALAVLDLQLNGLFIAVGAGHVEFVDAVHRLAGGVLVVHGDLLGDLQGAGGQIVFELDAFAAVGLDHGLDIVLAHQRDALAQSAVGDALLHGVFAGAQIGQSYGVADAIYDIDVHIPAESVGAGHGEVEGVVDVLQRLAVGRLAVQGDGLGNGQAAVGDEVVGELGLGGHDLVAGLGHDRRGHAVGAHQLDLFVHAAGKLCDGIVAGNQVLQLDGFALAVLDLDFDVLVLIAVGTFNDETVLAVRDVEVLRVNLSTIVGDLLDDFQLAGGQVVGECGGGQVRRRAGGHLHLHIVVARQRHVDGQIVGILGDGVLAGDQILEDDRIAVAILDLDLDVLGVVQRAGDGEFVGAVRRRGAGPLAVDGDILGDAQLAGDQVVGKLRRAGTRGRHIRVHAILAGQDDVDGPILRLRILGNLVRAGHQAGQGHGVAFAVLNRNLRGLGEAVGAGHGEVIGAIHRPGIGGLAVHGDILGNGQAAGGQIVGEADAAVLIGLDLRLHIVGAGQADARGQLVDILSHGVQAGPQTGQGRGAADAVLHGDRRRALVAVGGAGHGEFVGAVDILDDIVGFLRRLAIHGDVLGDGQAAVGDEVVGEAHIGGLAGFHPDVHIVAGDQRDLLLLQAVGGLADGVYAGQQLRQRDGAGYAVGDGDGPGLVVIVGTGDSEGIIAIRHLGMRGVDGLAVVGHPLGDLQAAGDQLVGEFRLAGLVGLHIHRHIVGGFQHHVDGHIRLGDSILAGNQVVQRGGAALAVGNGDFHGLGVIQRAGHGEFVGAVGLGALGRVPVHLDILGDLQRAGGQVVGKGNLAGLALDDLDVLAADVDRDAAGLQAVGRFGDAIGAGQQAVQLSSIALAVLDEDGGGLLISVGALHQEAVGAVHGLGVCGVVVHGDRLGDLQAAGGQIVGEAHRRGGVGLDVGRHVVLRGQLHVRGQADGDLGHGVGAGPQVFQRHGAALRAIDGDGHRLAVVVGTGHIEGIGPLDVLDDIIAGREAVHGDVLGDGQAAIRDVIVGDLGLDGLVVLALGGPDGHAPAVGDHFDLLAQAVGDLGDHVLAGHQVLHQRGIAHAVGDGDLGVAGLGLHMGMALRTHDGEFVGAVRHGGVGFIHRAAVVGDLLDDLQAAGGQVVGERRHAILPGGHLGGHQVVFGGDQRHIGGQAAGILGDGVGTGHQVVHLDGIALAVLDGDGRGAGLRRHGRMIVRAGDGEGIVAVRRLAGGGLAVHGDILGDDQLAGGQIVGHGGAGGALGGHAGVHGAHGGDADVGGQAGLVLGDVVVAGQQAGQGRGIAFAVLNRNLHRLGEAVGAGHGEFVGAVHRLAGGVLVVHGDLLGNGQAAGGQIVGEGRAGRLIGRNHLHQIVVGRQRDARAQPGRILGHGVFTGPQAGQGRGAAYTVLHGDGHRLAVAVGAGHGEVEGAVDILLRLGVGRIAVHSDVLGDGQAAVGHIVVGERRLAGLDIFVQLGRDRGADVVCADQLELLRLQPIGDLGHGVFAGHQAGDLGGIAHAVGDGDLGVVGLGLHVGMIVRAGDGKGIGAVRHFGVFALAVDGLIIIGDVFRDLQLAGGQVVGERRRTGFGNRGGHVRHHAVFGGQHHIGGQIGLILGDGVLAGHQLLQCGGAALAVGDGDGCGLAGGLHLGVVGGAGHGKGVGAVRRLAGGGLAVHGDILGDDQLAGGQVVGEFSLLGLAGHDLRVHAVHADHGHVRGHAGLVLGDPVVAGQQAGQQGGVAPAVGDGDARGLFVIVGTGHGEGVGAVRRTAGGGFAVDGDVLPDLQPAGGYIVGEFEIGILSGPDFQRHIVFAGQPDAHAQAGGVFRHGVRAGPQTLQLLGAAYTVLHGDIDGPAEIVGTGHGEGIGAVDVLDGVLIGLAAVHGDLLGDGQAAVGHIIVGDGGVAFLVGIDAHLDAVGAHQLDLLRLQAVGDLGDGVFAGHQAGQLAGAALAVRDGDAHAAGVAIGAGDVEDIGAVGHIRVLGVDVAAIVCNLLGDDQLAGGQVVGELGRAGGRGAHGGLDVVAAGQRHVHRQVVDVLDHGVFAGNQIAQRGGVALAVLDPDLDGLLVIIGAGDGEFVGAVRRLAGGGLAVDGDLLGDRQLAHGQIVFELNLGHLAGLHGGLDVVVAHQGDIGLELAGILGHHVLAGLQAGDGGGVARAVGDGDADGIGVLLVVGTGDSEVVGAVHRLGGGGRTIDGDLLLDLQLAGGQVIGELGLDGGILIGTRLDVHVEFVPANDRHALGQPGGVLSDVIGAGHQLFAGPGAALTVGNLDIKGECVQIVELVFDPGIDADGTGDGEMIGAVAQQGRGLLAVHGDLLDHLDGAVFGGMLIGDVAAVDGGGIVLDRVLGDVVGIGIAVFVGLVNFIPCIGPVVFRVEHRDRFEGLVLLAVERAVQAHGDGLRLDAVEVGVVLPILVRGVLGELRGGIVELDVRLHVVGVAVVLMIVAQPGTETSAPCTLRRLGRESAFLRM